MRFVIRGIFAFFVAAIFAPAFHAVNSDATAQERIDIPEQYRYDPADYETPINADVIAEWESKGLDIEEQAKKTRAAKFEEEAKSAMDAITEATGSPGSPGVEIYSLSALNTYIDDKSVNVTIKYIRSPSESHTYYVARFSSVENADRCTFTFGILDVNHDTMEMKLIPLETNGCETTLKINEQDEYTSLRGTHSHFQFANGYLAKVN